MRQASKTFAGWRFVATLLLTVVGAVGMATSAVAQTPNPDPLGSLVRPTVAQTPGPDPLSQLLQNLVAPLAPVLTPPSQHAPAGGGTAHPAAVPAAPAAAVPPNPEVYCAPAPAPLVFARTPGRTSQALVDAVTKHIGAGQTLQAVLMNDAPPFPLAGSASYRDDWGEPRSTPCPHLHQGNDIFANFGTPFVAPEGGVVSSYGFESVGGNAVYFSGDDGYSFYGAHLEGFAPGLATGVHVPAGTLLGFVGNTGDAASGSPHLHFQLYPPGHGFSSPVDPKAWLDAALNAAIERAGGVVPGPDGTIPGGSVVNLGALMGSVLTVGGHIISQPTVPVLLLVVLILGALVLAQTRTFRVAVELRRSRAAASVPAFLVSDSAFSLAAPPVERRVRRKRKGRGSAVAEPEPDVPVWARPPAVEEKKKERKPLAVVRMARWVGGLWARFPAAMSRVSTGSSGKARRRGPADAGSLLAMSAANGRKGSR